MRLQVDILNKQNNTGRQRGFTLIELLVVLVILGLLMSVVGPRVMKYVGGAKSDTAKMQIEELSSALICTTWR